MNVLEVDRRPDYYDALAFLHETLRPRAYLEIGVQWGTSIRLARPETLAVGVDPRPRLGAIPAGRIHVESMTSDAFFSGPRPRELFGTTPVELAFVDGMHLFEYALRDFINIEALAGPQSVVTIHDCLPTDAAVAARRRTKRLWSGDVWKLLLILVDKRPDLAVSIVDVPPTGLALVSGLQQTNAQLKTDYEAIHGEYGPLTFAAWTDRLSEVLERTVRPLAANWEGVWRKTLEQHGLPAEGDAEKAFLRAELARQAQRPSLLQRALQSVRTVR